MKLWSVVIFTWIKKISKVGVMKCFTVFIVAGLFLLMVKSTIALEKYSDKFDNSMDVDAILANDAERNLYYNCFMSIAACPNEAAEFYKGNMPEAVVTSCARCTEWQILAFNKIAGWYTEHDETAWNALVAKFIDEAKAANVASSKI